MVAEVMSKIHAPALSSLIARARSAPIQPDCDPLSRALPHEAWLANSFGLSSSLQAKNSPPLAALLMASYGLVSDDGTWFILHPANIRVGFDHMLMADTRTLALSDAESRALFDAALPFFENAGVPLLYGDAMTWFVRADDWKDLQTSTPDVACGRHLAHWLPRGENELSWRKLHTEVQMLWHIHPVNAARQQRGENTINALWLWGASGTAALKTSPPNTSALRFSGLMNAYAELLAENRPDVDAARILTSPPNHGLLWLDQLIAPALAGDWHEWLVAYTELEQDWFAPLLAGLQKKQIDRITLHLSNDTKMVSLTSDRISQRKFWLRKSLERLQS